jgi:hypothetical protein
MLAVAPVKENVALAAGKHQARGLAAGEEAGIAGHFPHFAKHPLGGLDDRKIDVGADVEDANLQRGVLVGIARKDTISSSFRASSARPNTLPSAASISLTSGASFSPLRRPTKTVKPSDANFLAISPPMKSPAPYHGTVAFRFFKGSLQT